MMPDCDPEVRIFLSVPHTHDEFFLLHILYFYFFFFLIMQSLRLQTFANCDDNTVTLSDVIIFSDVNLNNGVP